jgi:broad specificity phosphatase PhoE
MDRHDHGEAGSSRLVLIRHGEGKVNVDGIIGGLQGCSGLTDLGRRQAKALTARWTEAGFRPDVLVSSPVRRARETGDCIASSIPGLVVTEDCALCEMHLGEADGLTWPEYDNRYGRFDLEAEPSRPFAPGAESWADVMARPPGRVARAYATQFRAHNLAVAAYPTELELQFLIRGASSTARITRSSSG